LPRGKLFSVNYFSGLIDQHIFVFMKQDTKNLVIIGLACLIVVTIVAFIILYNEKQQLLTELEVSRSAQSNYTIHSIVATNVTVGSNNQISIQA
jgi:hypothetical protein